VLHVRALRVAAQLAEDAGDNARATTLRAEAEALSAAIRARFTLADGTLGAFVTTTLDPSTVSRWDLLGTSLAVLEGVVDPAAGRVALSAYPHLPNGAPVVFPQQKETAIYHNRAVWPFVTAYAALAGRAVGHPAVVTHAVNTLMRGAAFNLSHMENWEVVSGRAYLADGAYSGPVVNSRRQLWSVAAMVSVVHQVLLGVEARGDRWRVRPFIPWDVRNTLLRGTDTLVLRNVPWGDKRIHVRVALPPVDDAQHGALELDTARLGTTPIPPEGVLRADVPPVSTVLVTLANGAAAQPLRTLTDTADYRVLFGPRPPQVTSVNLEGNALRVGWNANGEAASDVTFSVFRDGVRVADGLSAGTLTHLDSTATPQAVSHCYSVEATFVVGGNRSQHAAPFCHWGAGLARIVTQEAGTFTHVGGAPSTAHGRFHHEPWGAPGDSITGPVFTADATGLHLVHVVAGNGGPINTGLSCGHKRLRVVRTSDGVAVGSGYVVMPHLGAWARWADSSYVPVQLQAGVSYRVAVDGDAHAFNMSSLRAAESYTGGVGGSSAANFVNISAIKILRMVGP
jgi:hypothetical protein